MRGLPDDELASLLERWGLTETLQQRVDKATAIITRAQQKPGKVANDQIKKMIGASVRRDLLGENRRMLRESVVLEVVNQIDVDKQNWVRMGENDDNTCEGCDPLIGAEGTLAYHSEIGMPGPASCEGGDMCRCTLMLVD
jgi:hypothetical protein